MNPESKEFIAAGGHKDGLSAPSTLAQSAQTTQPASTEVNQHPWPIPSIVVTPFVNQLPPQSELLGYNLNKKQRDLEMKRKHKSKQTSRPVGGSSLFPPGMSGSSSSSAGTRQMAGGNGVTGSPASQGLIGFNEHASNTTPQGGSMIAVYGQGQANQHSYMTSVRSPPKTRSVPFQTPARILTFRSSLRSQLQDRTAHQELLDPF